MPAVRPPTPCQKPLDNTAPEFYSTTRSAHKRPTPSATHLNNRISPNQQWGIWIPPYGRNDIRGAAGMTEAHTHVIPAQAGIQRRGCAQKSPLPQRPHPCHSDRREESKDPHARQASGKPTPNIPSPSTGKGQGEGENTPKSRTPQMSHCDTLIRYENATPVAFRASPRYKLYATL